MGKDTGFKEWNRTLPPKRPIADRLRDYRELYLPKAPEAAREQAGRCMDCGVPFCQQGCPLGNHIPDWNDLVYRDRWQQAHARLAATNNFPEFTGRLCPAPCEGACTLAINDRPVTIEEIEKEIIEHAFAEGWVRPAPPRQRSQSRIAIVGSGPAGLAAAAQLNSIGHNVTVYERDDRLGGLLRYGIPDFKMEKHVIDRRLELLAAEGVQFQTGADVGGALGWAELKGDFDALLIATGARVARDLDVPGRELEGVHMAMDYLEQQNRVIAGDASETRISAAGKRVLILGGGDTGSDCLGTALRHGAAQVTQIELMPAPPQERAPHNPWPQWPMILRTSSSQEEGGEREFAILTKRLAGAGGKVTHLHAVRIDVEPKPGGGFELRERGQDEVVLAAELVILAMGFTGPEVAPLREQLGIVLDRRGNVATDETFATSIPGVFAAGDAKRGASLIVWAIAEGREAARHIDSYLRAGAPPWLPTRGIDQPFGGR